MDPNDVVSMFSHFSPLDIQKETCVALEKLRWSISQSKIEDHTSLDLVMIKKIKKHACLFWNVNIDPPSPNYYADYGIKSNFKILRAKSYIF